MKIINFITFFLFIIDEYLIILSPIRMKLYFDLKLKLILIKKLNEVILLIF
jgi:hypothetical protein